jgi:hypothetical protein
MLLEEVGGLMLEAFGVLAGMALCYLAGRMAGYKHGHADGIPVGWERGWKARKDHQHGANYGMRRYL